MKILIFLSVFSLFSFHTTKGVEITEERIAVHFTRHLEFNDLVKIKLDVAEVGIALTYKKLVFDDYNKLKEINFAVDCHDGFSGSAGHQNLTNHSQFGFIRDYKGKIPFSTGGLNN